jgi:hypothetical protein
MNEAMNDVYAGSEMVSDATWVAADRCMADEGYPSSISYRDIGSETSFVDNGEAVEEVQLDTWFGVSQAKWGAKYGYHEVPQSALYTVERTEGVPGPDGYEDALWGPREDRDAYGCMGDAVELINEGTPSREELGAIQLEVTREVASRVHSDAGIATADAEWSACMAADGYQYASPRDAFDAFAPFVDDEIHAYTRDAATEEEKRVAEADGACKEETGFWDAVREATDAAEAEVAIAMHTEIMTIRQAHERMMENASAILASK